MHQTTMRVSDQKFTFPTEVHLPAVKNYVLAKGDEAYNFLLYTTGSTAYNPVQYRFDKYEDVKMDDLSLRSRAAARPIEDVTLNQRANVINGTPLQPAVEVGRESFQVDSRPPGCACSSVSSGFTLDKVFNPEFNMREIGKQMILLEDHLFNPYRRCNDCITKHTLMIEALIEEAITLDEEAKYQQQLQDLLASFRQISRSLMADVKAKQLPTTKAVVYAQNIRLLRKPICREYCDFY